MTVHRGHRVGARRVAAASAALSLALSWLVLSGSRGVAQIPPTGPQQTTARLTVSSQGSISAAESTSFEALRDAELDLGAAAPIGFRLPDRHPGPFPVYLRPSYHDPSATLNGDRLPLEVQREGHAYLAVHGTEVHDGDYRFVLRYRQDGGARVVGDQVEIRWRELSQGVHRVVVHGPDLVGARCVDEFWRERPCGRVVDGALVVDEEDLRGKGGDTQARSLVIVAEPDAYDLAAPHLDRD